jgi:nucleoside diphosphate kinase
LAFLTLDRSTYQIVLLWLQVWEGNGVVASARKLIGATNPLAAEPGTIRGDYAIEVSGSSSSNMQSSCSLDGRAR